MAERSLKLEIRDMTKRYDNGDGVEHINLKIYEGEIVTMLGPSGCGKSTILRTIGGFLDVTDGDILIDNESIVKLPPEKRPTAMVFQSYNLWTHMTVYENLAFGLKLRKIPKDQIRADIDKHLKLVSMSGFEKKYPTQLSGGQQQRIAIARSLLLKPSVLLLDEPFSALDAKIRQQMREELKKIQAELGITVVFVTHDQEEAMALSHRIVVMNKGKFEQVGTPTEIYDNPATKYVASFIGEMNFVEKDGKTVEEKVQELFLAVRENIKVRRFARYEGKVVSYVHAGGKIGVLVNFDTALDADNAEFVQMGKNIAMQIAAMNPAYLDEASVPAEVLEKEKEILIAQMKEDPKMANKPEAVLGKIVDGKIGKYYKENCLVDQQFVMDGEITVGKYVENTAKALGSDIKIVSFVRFEKGEGIEKRVDDFAAEVAGMVK